MKGFAIMAAETVTHAGAKADRRYASAVITVAAGTCVRTIGLSQPGWSEADDALDLVRMDDDRGWQMTRPPA